MSTPTSNPPTKVPAIFYFLTRALNIGYRDASMDIPCTGLASRFSRWATTTVYAFGGIFLPAVWLALFGQAGGESQDSPDLLPVRQSISLPFFRFGDGNWATKPFPVGGAQ